MEPLPAQPTHAALVNDWIRTFGLSRHDYTAAGLAVHDAVVARLRDDSLNYHHIQHRIKVNDSLGEKLSRRNPDGSYKYRHGLDEIDDLIGVRVILFLESDIASAMAALGSAFKLLDHVDKTAEQKARGEFGYSGHHLILEVPDHGAAPPGCAPWAGYRFEVQFRTILQHAWAEFEHDIRFKGPGPVPPEVNRAFTLASGLIELADREFDTISSLVAARKGRGTNRDAVAAAADDHLTGPALRALFEVLLPEYPRSRAEQYDWLTEVLRVNGVSGLGETEELFRSAPWPELAARLGYRFAPGHVRAADDALLHRWGRGYVERTADLDDNGKRGAKLEYRLRRLARDGGAIG